jgi:hypothetical protein
MNIVQARLAFLFGELIQGVQNQSSHVLSGFLLSGDFAFVAHGAYLELYPIF